MLQNCGHVGCASCLQENINTNGKYTNGTAQCLWVACPVCRVSYTQYEMKPYHNWERLSMAAFNQVQVKCPGNIIGMDIPCSFVGSIAELAQHEQFVCERRWIQCPNRRCDVQGTAKDVKEHFKTCDKLAVFCTGCQLPVKWSGREEHQCIVELNSALQTLIGACRSEGVKVNSNLLPGVAGQVVLRSSEIELDSTYSEIASTSMRATSGSNPASGFATPVAPTSSPTASRELLAAPRVVRYLRTVQSNQLNSTFGRPDTTRTRRQLADDFT